MPADPGTIAGAVFVVVAATSLALAFRAPAHVSRVLAASRRAAEVLRDASLSDDEKEKHAQRASGELFGLFLQIAASFAGALLIPVGVLWLAQAAKLVSLDAVLAMTISPVFLVVCTVVGCAAVYAWRRATAGRRSAS
jgi:hypothetical protein